MAFSLCRIFAALLAGMFLVPAVCGAQTNRSLETVSGVVQDALGRPIPNASVTLKSPSGKSLTQTRTDDRGLFRLNEANPGAYVIAVWSSAFVPASATVTLPVEVRKSKRKFRFKPLPVQGEVAASIASGGRSQSEFSLGHEFRVPPIEFCKVTSFAAFRGLG